MLSLLFIVCNTLKSWNTNPSMSLLNAEILLFFNVLVLRPLISTLPSIGESKVAIIFNKVDFPNPDSLMIATNSPL